jgi:hypothetical protein
VVVKFSLANSPGDLGLGYTGLAMTLIALPVLAPPNASALRSCAQLMRRLGTAPVSAQRGGWAGSGVLSG